MFKTEARNLGSYEYIFNQDKFGIPQCVQNLRDSTIRPKKGQSFQDMQT